MSVQLVITGEPATGAVQVSGPIQNMQLVHWLLGEARRICERDAVRRESGPGNGQPQLVVSRELPPAPINLDARLRGRP